MANDLLYPPLAVNTPDDQRGTLWIISILSLLFVWLTFATRCYVRWGRFQPDDYAILSACTVGIIQYAVVFAAAAIGLGATQRRGMEDTSRTAWQLFVSSEALYVVAIFLSKAAVILTIDRLLAPDMRLHRMVSRCTLAVIGVLGVASLLGITIDCNIRSLLAPILTDRCSQTPRWAAIAAADALTEFWIFGFICWIVWSLQMKTQLKWAAVSFFMLRIFCVIFSSLHAYYMSTFVHSTNPSVDVVPSLVWQQLALCYSIVSALIIALRPFLKDLHTGMGIDMARMTGTVASNNHSYPKGSRGEAYELHNTSVRARDHKGRSSLTIDDEGSGSERSDLEQNKTKYRPDAVQYSASIFHPRVQRQTSSGSTHSQQPIMIKRDVDYQISYEKA